MKKNFLIFIVLNVLTLLFIWMSQYSHSNQTIRLIIITIMIGISGYFVYHFFYKHDRTTKNKIRRLLQENNTKTLLKNDNANDEMLELISRVLIEFSQEKAREHSYEIVDKQVQISTLQSQINPHFLYNTMESIRGQALLDGADEIARICEALSSFFRYSIDQKGNFVTLQDEMTNINNYLFIQQYRFREKIITDFQIDEEDENIYDYLLPKLTIQPVVENAIYHGLEMKGEKGKLIIEASATKERLLIRISDDGIGMEPEILQKLNRKLENMIMAVENKDTIGTGLALINVNRRIKLVYGSDYGIYVYSTLNRGTDVEIVLPLIKDKKNLLDPIKE